MQENSRPSPSQGTAWKDVHRQQFRAEDLVDFSAITTPTNVGILRRTLEFIGDSIRSKSHLFGGDTSAHDTVEDYIVHQHMRNTLRWTCHDYPSLMSDALCKHFSSSREHDDFLVGYLLDVLVEEELATAAPVGLLSKRINEVSFVLKKTSRIDQIVATYLNKRTEPPTPPIVKEEKLPPSRRMLDEAGVDVDDYLSSVSK